MYYASTLFKNIGFNNSTAVGLIIAGVNFIFTLVALRVSTMFICHEDAVDVKRALLQIVDPVGRRRVMCWTSPGMFLSLALAAIFFHCERTSGTVWLVGRHFSPCTQPASDLTLKTGGRLVEGSNYSSTWSGLILMAMIFYVASYATGVGNIAWQQGELFRLEVRGIGTSLGTATNWVGCIPQYLSRT